MTTHNMQLPPPLNLAAISALATLLLPHLCHSCLCYVRHQAATRVALVFLSLSLYVCVCTHTQKPPKAATDDDNKTVTTAATATTIVAAKHASFRSIFSKNERGGERGEGQWVHRTLTQVFRITSGLLCPMGHCGSASSIYSPNYSTNFWHCLKVCNTFHSCLCLRLRCRLRCLSACHFASCKQRVFCYLLLYCVCGSTHTVHVLEYMLGHTHTLTKNTQTHTCACSCTDDCV